MSLHIYNTAHRKKEVFSPIREDKIGIYVCGVTVYDLCHIGHARSAIIFDVIVRYLRARGFQVTYVRNFTDVDDKIIDRARETGEDTNSLAERHIRAFYEDMHELGVLDADIEPRATEHIDDIIEMIQRMIEKGHAYNPGSNVYFSVESFDGYGKLSGRRLEEMIAGSRVEVDEKKRHPMDFVLWKGAKPGEPKWKSPWGEGRPGWHIECSAMSCRYLGSNFDIHGGGRDLVFPHHENERAQAMAASGVNFANYWIHNGFLTVESQKMSKSLGNFITVRDALRLYHPQVLRLFLLSKHYRSPLDFSKHGLSEAKTGLIKIYRTLLRLEEIIGPYEKDSREIGDTIKAGGLEDDDFKREFFQAMDDDFNTAAVLGLLFNKTRDINRLIDPLPSKAGIKSRLEKERGHLLECARILGLLQEKPSEFLKEISGEQSVDPKEVEGMIRQRDETRKKKDYAKADAIRDRLRDKGVILEDGPQGTTWRFEV